MLIKLAYYHCRFICKMSTSDIRSAQQKILSTKSLFFSKNIQFRNLGQKYEYLIVIIIYIFLKKPIKEKKNE